MIAINKIIFSNAFYHCTHLPTIDPKYAIEASTSDYVEPVGPTGPRTVKAVSSFQKTKFCYSLLKEFGYVKTSYLRVPPNSIYDWHNDVDRKCGINFLLSEDPDCLTLFRKPTDNRLLYNIKTCDYTLYQPTVFNTTFDHCIINNSKNFRYLLTVTVGSDTTFELVRDFLINYQITSY